MAISRFLVDRWPDVRWFPFWFNGVPFENTYSPLLQAIVAVVAKAAHCSTALAFHAVIAFFYCLGPVFLFLFAWKASKLLHAAFLSGLLYSLYLALAAAAGGARRYRKLAQRAPAADPGALRRRRPQRGAEPAAAGAIVRVAGGDAPELRAGA